MDITREVAEKVLKTVDVGLCVGLGKPIPGKMCVEAAVCYVMVLPHGDEPACVSPALRSLKIRLNDSLWSSDQARAKGLRRLAVAQLGSAGHLDEREFVRRVVDYTIRVTAPRAMRIAAGIVKDAERAQAMLDAAAQCEKDGTHDAALKAKKTAYADGAATAAPAPAAAYAAAAAAAANANAYAADATAAAYAAAANAYAADATAAAYADGAKRDEELSLYAEAVVQILIEMK